MPLRGALACGAGEGAEGGQHQQPWWLAAMQNRVGACGLAPGRAAPPTGCKCPASTVCPATACGWCAAPARRARHWGPGLFLQGNVQGRPAGCPHGGRGCQHQVHGHLRVSRPPAAQLLPQGGLCAAACMQKVALKNTSRCAPVVVSSASSRTMLSVVVPVGTGWPAWRKLAALPKWHRPRTGCGPGATTRRPWQQPQHCAAGQLSGARPLDWRM